MSRKRNAAFEYEQEVNEKIREKTGKMYKETKRRKKQLSKDEIFENRWK